MLCIYLANICAKINKRICGYFCKHKYYLIFLVLFLHRINFCIYMRSKFAEKYMVIFALRKNCRTYLQFFLQSTTFFAKKYGKKYVKKLGLLYEISWAFPRRIATVWRMIARVHMFDVLMFVRFTLIMLQTLTIDSQEHRGHQSSGAQAPEL